MSSPPDGGTMQWRDPAFWEALQRAEARLQRVDARHDSARRVLESVDARDADALRAAWLEYREAIAELDRSAEQAAELRVAIPPDSLIQKLDQPGVG